MTTATDELDVRQLIGRAAVRAVPPKRFTRLVADLVARKGLEADAAERAIAVGLLHHLVRPSAPGILVNYLAQALAAPLFTARTFVVALLTHLYRSDAIATASITPQLVSISSALLANPTGLGPGDVLPSPIELASDIPDVGTSESAAAAPEQAPALSLILPLLRQCAAMSPPPPPLLAIASRLTTLIPPLPAPPFDVGLEAAQLSAVLPEDVGRPLRECLAGLMADLPLPDAPAQDVAGLFGVPDVGQQSGGFGDIGAGMTMSSLRATPLPLQQTTEFLIEYVRRAQGWTRNVVSTTEPPQPAPHLIHMLKLGRSLSADSSAFMSALLDAAAARVLAAWSKGPGEAVFPFVFFTEQLPILFKWWHDNSDPKWPYPATLQQSLSNIFASHGPQLATWYQALTALYTAKFTQIEPDDEAGPYQQPDGWVSLSLEGTAVRRHTSLGLLDEDASVILIGSPVKAAPGESLIERLANCAPSHLPALENFITHAAGSAQSLGAEIVQAITAAPQTPPPENLFARLASSPMILSLISAYITPCSLLDLLVTHLLRDAEDPTRAEDPGAALIRFGSGVTLIEVLCAQFELPLPDLLYDSRRALNLANLSEHHQSNLNGWVKALFGSDGIDDEILLSTSSSDICRLSSTLVHQAVVAAVNGQIDLDTLHSGLSYFAQPLLSWCLGGVVGWLCTEIERQGLLSGLHLNVLQTLVLDSSFPEPLLQANSRAINRLLEPATGLDAVLQSSSFDTAAVRQRLQAVGSPAASSIPETSAAPSLPALRSELQGVRHLDLAAPGWDSRLLDALDGALLAHGPLRTINSVLTDMLHPSMLEVDANASDPLGQFAALLFALRLPRSSTLPLVATLVDGYIPTLFGPRSPFIPVPPMPGPAILGVSVPAVPGPPPPPLPFAAHALHRLLRASLLAAESFSQDGDTTTFADMLAAHLATELAFQRGRPSSANRAKRQQPPRGSLAGATADPGLSTEQRELLDTLTAALEADDELKARWPVLGGAKE
ncbi:Mediator of RNA polymerase II transcription subunit 5 [Vanrija pseudolonga]|uniref:Mediator of RNA polymerase II transcription subunit 5 n=1 Tax=Vanrija pseudolonga TaxID=143232 RepID=A0AAF1BK38_9TREE|nr:Mediator of RNA polymerase II transcription subunit 5 [Vanrija pseudolonga]